MHGAPAHTLRYVDIPGRPSHGSINRTTCQSFDRHVIPPASISDTSGINKNLPTHPTGRKTSNGCFVLKTPSQPQANVNEAYPESTHSHTKPTRICAIPRQYPKLIEVGDNSRAIPRVPATVPEYGLSRPHGRTY